jgi:hypothetical protein
MGTSASGRVSDVGEGVVFAAPAQQEYVTVKIYRFSSCFSAILH